MSNIVIKGASENNLKNIDVNIPVYKASVIVGLSGSGKTSLAFDTIYAEGQRRYIASLSSYARQFLERIDKVKVESIENIAPTIAVEQKNKIRNSKSTVGSITELYEYLRLLYAKIGVARCDECGVDVRKETVDTIINKVLDRYNGTRAYIMFKVAGTKQDLLMAGFMRVFDGSELYDLSDPEVEIPDNHYVVYDRFLVNEAEKNRIWEAFEKSLSFGNRRCYVYIVDTKELIPFVLDSVCSVCGKVFEEADPRIFSFESPVGACPECNGFGSVLNIDEEKLVPDPSLSLLGGALDILNKPSVKHIFYDMINFLGEKGVDINKPFFKLKEEEKKIIYEGGSKGKKKFIGLNEIFKELERKKYKVYIRVLLNKYKTAYTCPVCSGTRLKKQALNYLIAGKNIAGPASMSISEFNSWLSGLKLSTHEKDVSREILKQLYQRSAFIHEIGLSYLTMDRLARTLSNGEAQRINLSNQLGASLVDAIYVLDEPSVGLHPRDVDRLINMIYKIRDNGNTVLVVEHDPKMIKSMDYVIELGPESGSNGGNLVYSGSIDDFCSSAKTITAQYVCGVKNTLNFKTNGLTASTKFLHVSGLVENNLKNISVDIPLNTFVCVTGVSGSGKSSFVTKSLYPILLDKLKLSSSKAPLYKDIKGCEHIDNVVLIDQESIGRSNRSTPITFMSGFDNIREIFAQTALAKSRAYTSSNFSFNVAGGQCPTCSGDGFIAVDMQFMADIYMKCETCNGTRYKKEVLDVTYKGKNIAEVLQMTVKDAYEFFISYQYLRNMFKLLMDVGLDYLVIGQAASTLSGGEAQRLKICKELLGDNHKRTKSNTLYIMDEPTTGLHPSEVDKLLIVIQKLIAEGNTVLVVEHNMDFIKHCGYIIDMGPDAGALGGYVIAKGTPQELILNEDSYTAKFLKEVL